jgi:hypothetical protein
MHLPDQQCLYDSPRRDGDAVLLVHILGIVAHPLALLEHSAEARTNLGGDGETFLFTRITVSQRMVSFKSDVSPRVSKSIVIQKGVPMSNT